MVKWMESHQTNKYRNIFELQLSECKNEQNTHSLERATSNLQVKRLMITLILIEKRIQITEEPKREGT